MTAVVDLLPASARLELAMADPGHLFTRDQVADLVARAAALERADAFEAGYWERVAQENGMYPPEPVFHAREWMTQAERVERRRRFDSDRTPGFPGGLPIPADTFPAEPGRRPPPFPRPSAADREFARRWWLAHPD